MRFSDKKLRFKKQFVWGLGVVSILRLLVKDRSTSRAYGIKREPNGIFAFGLLVRVVSKRLNRAYVELRHNSVRKL